MEEAIECKWGSESVECEGTGGCGEEEDVLWKGNG